jgi:hypothetical protein
MGEVDDPDAPISIFDRILMPQAFVPTRRAPRPPQPQSWIDLSEDDDDDDSVVDKPTGHTARVAPSPSEEQPSSRLEREIMRMLQFNEERDGEARVIAEKKRKRNSSLSIGAFFGKLRRTASTAGRVEAAGPKRTSYFDYFG